MENPRKPRFAVSGLLVVAPLVLSAVAEARTPVTHHTTMDFRSLIVQGERPEIAACMVAALGLMRSDSKYDAIRWSESDSERAKMREVENGNRLIRNVQFNARVRERDHPLFTENWQTAEINCEQRDEESPEVRVRVISR